ncbi:MAG: hypothetical protein II366_02320 [Clostridia bacterium]|nr:hypothetical protein [Clostridia bacterium]
MNNYSIAHGDGLEITFKRNERTARSKRTVFPRRQLAVTATTAVVAITTKNCDKDENDNPFTATIV